MNRISFICFVLAAGLIISCNDGEEKSVLVSGRSIITNGSPYFIKGICYHPVPLGSSKREFNRIDEDIALMSEAGINTIRVYEPIAERTILDKFAEAGIKVIIGFGYNQNGNFDILSGSYREYVEMYKDHESILFWELGNEYNYHPEWFNGDIRNWYRAMNEAAKTIKELDDNHPVATAHGELPDSLALAMSPEIDIWGMNVYRWDNPEEIYKQWEEISSKPMYLSEAGADSYMTIENHGYKQGENEKAQLDATRMILEDVFSHDTVGSGVTLFQFIDGLWKAGNPDAQDPGGWAPNSSGVPYDGTPNEEYWGILDIERNKKEVFNLVKDMYTSYNH